MFLTSLFLKKRQGEHNEDEIAVQQKNKEDIVPLDIDKELLLVRVRLGLTTEDDFHAWQTAREIIQSDDQIKIEQLARAGDEAFIALIDTIVQGR